MYWNRYGSSLEGLVLRLDIEGQEGSVQDAGAAKVALAITSKEIRLILCLCVYLS